MAIAPNDSRVLLLFGEYKGSVRDSGFFWVNPFFTKKKLSLRIRNFETGSITTPEKKDAAGLKQGSGDEHLWELANLFSYEWNRKSWTPYAGGRDELRSVNGQVEYLLRRALSDAGRLRAGPPTSAPDGPPDPPPAVDT